MQAFVTEDPDTIVKPPSDKMEEKNKPISASTSEDGHASVPLALEEIATENRALTNKLQFLKQKTAAYSIEKDSPHEKIQETQRAQKWVQDAKLKAMETAAERTDFGYSRTKEAEEHEEPEPKGRHHISLVDNTGERHFSSRDELLNWLNLRKKPVEGIRIPTSLRPIDSGKLGPRTQWDLSDSDEWDSDESTRTRDFDYFQARLRSDFEWEIDRLMAQRRRYKIFRKKKEEKKAKESLRQFKNENESDNTEITPHGAGTEGDLNLPLLYAMEWDTFSAALEDRHSFFTIAILKGEPKVSSTTAFLKISRPPTHTMDTVQPEYDGKTALPERICIRSSFLVETLSSLNGSSIASDKEHKDVKQVVLLRPYRLLTFHDASIRIEHKQLEQKVEALKNALQEDMKSTFLDKTPADGVTADGTPTDNNDESNESGRQEYAKENHNLEELSCLVQFMDNYIVKRVSWLKSTQCENFHFSDIWHIFKPGNLVISVENKQAYRVASVYAGQHSSRDPFSAISRKNEADDTDDNPQNAVVSCSYIDFDGTLLGPVVQRFIIKRFDGERSISTLPVSPFRHYVSRNPKLARMIGQLNGELLDMTLDKEVERLTLWLEKSGRLFIEVVAVKHMYYAGMTADKRSEVESQVMIDVQEAFSLKENESLRPKFSRIHGIYENKNSAVGCNAECCDGQGVYDDTDVEEKLHEEFVAAKLAELGGYQLKKLPVSLYSFPLAETMAAGLPLSNADLVIMSSSIFGFVLRDRTWALLDVDFLSHIDKPPELETAPRNVGSGFDDEDDDTEDEEIANKTAFSRLVLPRGHKSMVLSLVAQHFRNSAVSERRNEETDIVKGKGKCKGLIILLHGAPGVGKTTTAEAVAEKFHRPLFRMTCGDLGVDAVAVEESLQRNFSLASRWGSILLLDEADVFLAARRREDFTRNGLVAVFLRVLEYYPGILFLTTNRIGDLDEAFTSRIHMSLHYPELEELPTAKICRLNLSMIHQRYKNASRKIKIDSDAIEEHIRDFWRVNVKARWNGRQIRNVCQTALALAEYEAQPLDKKYDLAAQADVKVHLKADHINRVSEAYLAFSKYLKEVHGTDANTKARELGLRALENMVGEAVRNVAYEAGQHGSDRGGSRGGGEAHPFQFRLKPPNSAPSGQQQQQQLPQEQRWQQEQQRQQEHQRQQEQMYAGQPSPYARTQFRPQENDPQMAYRYRRQYGQYDEYPAADTQPRIATRFETRPEYASILDNAPFMATQAYGESAGQETYRKAGYGKGSPERLP